MNGMGRPALPEVNACSWCDQPEQGHYNRWVIDLGWHQWVTPTDALRKARLLARRAARIHGRSPYPETTMAPMHGIDLTMSPALHYRLREVLDTKPCPICGENLAWWSKLGQHAHWVLHPLYKRVRHHIARWWSRRGARQ